MSGGGFREKDSGYSCNVWDKAGKLFRIGKRSGIKYIKFELFDPAGKFVGRFDLEQLRRIFGNQPGIPNS